MVRHCPETLRWSCPMTSKKFSAKSASFTTPLQAIAVLLLPLALLGLHYLAWASPLAAPPSRAGLVMGQAWAGVLILFGLAYASGLLPWATLRPRHLLRQLAAYRMHHAWLLWAAVGLWTSAWALAWLTLPVGFLLWTLVPVLFFGLALRSLGHGDAHALALRKGIMLSVLGLLAITAWYLTLHPFSVARAVSDWVGPMDVTGRHHTYAQVLYTWRELQLWGPSAQALSGENINAQGTALLQFMTHYGAGPGALLGVSCILACSALWRWLQQAPTGVHFSNAMRRMGLALLGLHGISTVFYVLFNMGITRQTFGSALPTGLGYLPWFLLTPALGLICWQAKRVPRVIRTTIVTSGVKNGWFSLAGYGLATVGISMALLIGNDYMRAAHFSQTIKLARTSTPPERQPLLAANGDVLAHNEQANDLWVTPSEFWGTSLLNPQSAAPTARPESTLNDEARQRRLLDALGPWPHIQSIVEYRLTDWPKSKASQVLLAWAIKPEVAKTLRALEMPGIVLKPRLARHYPEGSLYAHAVGFVGLSDNTRGQDGLELTANRQLMVRTTARSGVPEPQGLTTSLVPHIQRAAYAQLQAAMAQHSATGGAVVVIDVEKNAIAALVSAPDFDPNDASTFRNPYQPHRLLNRAKYVPLPADDLLAPLHAAQRIATGHTTPATQAERLALYKTLGLDIPVDASVGTPVQASLLQVLDGYIPLATDGYLSTAHPAQAIHSLRVLSSAIAALMRQNMPMTTLKNGTLAAGIRATLSSPKANTSDASVLIGMWPAAQPQWLVGVVLQYPHGKADAAEQATLPLFTQLANAVTRDYRLP